MRVLYGPHDDELSVRFRVLDLHVVSVYDLYHGSGDGTSGGRCGFGYRFLTNRFESIRSVSPENHIDSVS